MVLRPEQRYSNTPAIMGRRGKRVNRNVYLDHLCLKFIRIYGKGESVDRCWQELPNSNLLFDPSRE
jgi:hypothetical protein